MREIKLKEFLLFYNYNQKENYYKEFPYEYRYQPIIDTYGLIYTRDSIVLDIKYLGDLVSFLTTKKISRSSLSYKELFLIHQESISINDKFIHIKSNKPFALFPRNNFVTNKKPVFYTINHYFLPRKEEFERKSFNKYKNFWLTNKYNDEHYINKFDHLVEISHFNYTKIYSNSNISMFHPLYLNIYENIYMHHFLYYKKYENIFMYMHKPNIYLNNEDNVYNEDNIDDYEKIILNKIHADKLNIFENLDVYNKIKYKIINIIEKLLIKEIIPYKNVNIVKRYNIPIPNILSYFNFNGTNKVSNKFNDILDSKLFINHRFAFSIYMNENIYILYKDKILNEFYNSNLKRNILRLNGLSNINILRNKIFLNQYANINTKLADKFLNNQYINFLKDSNNKLFYCQNENASSKDKILFYHNIDSALMNNNYLFYLNNNFAKNNILNLSSFDFYGTSKYYDQLYISDSHIFGLNDNKTLYMNNTNLLYKNNIHVSLQDENALANQDNKYIYYYTENHLYNDNKNIYVQDENIFGKLYGKLLNTQYNFMSYKDKFMLYTSDDKPFLFKSYFIANNYINKEYTLYRLTNLANVKENLHLYKFKKYINVNEIKSLKIFKKYIYNKINNYNQLSFTSIDFNIDTIDEILFKAKKHISLYEYTFLNMINIFNNLNVFNSIKSLYRKTSNIYKLQDILYLYKKHNNINNLHSHYLTLNKSYKSITYYNNHNDLRSLYRIIYKIQTQGIDFFKNKYRNITTFHDTNINDNFDRVNRYIKKYTDQLFAKIYKKPTFIEHSLIGIFKEGQKTRIEEEYLYDTFKSYREIVLFNQKRSIVSINKINYPMFTHNIIDWIYKKLKEIRKDIKQDVTATKILKDIYNTNDELICDKISLNTNFIQLINEFAIKLQLQIRFINDDSFITKNDKSFKIQEYSFVNKIGQDLYLQNILDIFNKVSFELYVNKQQDVFDKHYNFNINNTFSSFNKLNYQVSFLNLEWFNHIRPLFIEQDSYHIDKTNYNLSYGKENDAFKKHVNFREDNTFSPSYLLSKDIRLSNKFITTNHQKPIFFKDIENILRNNRIPAKFYDQFFVDKKILINKIPELEDIEKIIYEAGDITDSQMDWVWVYQEDEPFDDPFKIDELLLPENDIIYEDFEDIIFNRKTGKPRDPVKVIDKYTFIAKYPIHYPIKDSNGENAYPGIDLEYFDQKLTLDERKVRTHIMRQVFLGYYKLWQDHIFEFAQMTMPQSAKKILDYLYAWILINFALEDIPEALRTFKLIRWYLERGIIECSEYYITYEPDNLTSGKMDTTNIDIPNDIFPEDSSIPANDTMYIDTTLHVIRNNQSKLHQDAYLTLYIDNPKDTIISFSLNTYTKVDIILNGVIIDTLNLPVSGKMVYNIPYTGSINEFQIKKDWSDNNDNFFFIGNIVIEGMGHNGNLNIEFNPKIQGNKVLNYVSYRVLSRANLQPDIDKVMDELSKGNIHLAEVYERLLEYWEIHHQEKDKGKRFTIKKT